jgi:hypothetical protein
MLVTFFQNYIYDEYVQKLDGTVNRPLRSLKRADTPVWALARVSYGDTYRGKSPVLSRLPKSSKLE